MNKAPVRMSGTPVIFALIVSALMIMAGLLVASNYLTKTYRPALDNQNTATAIQQALAEDNATRLALTMAAQQTADAQAAAAQQTAESLAATVTAQASLDAQQKTQTAIAAQQTADAQATSVQQTADAQMTAVAAEATASAAPTATPPASSCEATMKGDGLMYPIPGFVFPYNGATNLSSGTSVTVLWMLRSPAWVQVEYNNQKGFMRTDMLRFNNSNCKPGIADLHFLTGWLKPDWRVIVDDMFVSNQHTWTTEDGVRLEIDNTNLRAESSGAETVFSTDALRQGQLSTFTLHTYFEVISDRGNSYLGFRFLENNGLFYQIRFYPDDCSYALYQEETEVIPGKFDQSVCQDNYYYLGFSLNENHQLMQGGRYYVMLEVNGKTSSPINLNLDPQGFYMQGGLGMVVSNMTTDFNYFVVTTPR